MSDEVERQQPKGIPCIAITDAAREAILAVHEVFEEFIPHKPESDEQITYHRKATAAALRAALVAVGED